MQLRSLSSAANDAFRKLNNLSFAQSKSCVHPKTPPRLNWRQSANYRRMSAKLFGTQTSQERSVEDAIEKTEEANPVSGERLDDEDNEGVTDSVVNARLQKLSHLITLYLGLSEAWRQNLFK